VDTCWQRVLHQKHNVNPILFQILWQGIITTLLQHDLEEPNAHYSNQYLQLYQAQAKIGWIHILQGRIAFDWVHIAENQGINGTNFYAKVIQLCWQFVLTTWMEWNWALHNTSNLYDTSNLRVAVKQIFHNTAQHLDTQATIRDQTVDSILSQPFRQASEWMDCAAMHLWNHAKALATRAKLHTHNIWSFFTRKPTPTPINQSDENLLQPP